ncbi:hypothetical protein D9615_008528 [Tricholomella constricta]|uniref:Uncharacterized protein n=1 Tax=Tricholomella constricta TaxID=117010 RepID=A0A8H5H3X1_9AGAR|nr:hypothetical protein D9615_008528 [Tricholomella constricta]
MEHNTVLSRASMLRSVALLDHDRRFQHLPFLLELAAVQTLHADAKSMNLHNFKSSMRYRYRCRLKVSVVDDKPTMMLDKARQDQGYGVDELPARRQHDSIRLWCRRSQPAAHCWGTSHLLNMVDFVDVDIYPSAVLRSLLLGTLSPGLMDESNRRLSRLLAYCHKLLHE